jgi:hypothetical protein
MWRILFLLPDVTLRLAERSIPSIVLVESVPITGMHYSNRRGSRGVIRANKGRHSVTSAWATASHTHCSPNLPSVHRARMHRHLDWVVCSTTVVVTTLGSRAVAIKNPPDRSV